MFSVTFHVKWNGTYYTKNVIIAFKILISKCWRFSACASWFTIDQEGHKIYWASNNPGTRHILNDSIYDNLHANIIMPSAIWLARQPPTRTILYMYCTGGTECLSIRPMLVCLWSNLTHTVPQNENIVMNREEQGKLKEDAKCPSSLSVSKCASSQIREWLRPKWQKCHSEHQTLFIHICEGLGTRLLPNVLHCSWSLHPNCVFNQSPSAVS